MRVYILYSLATLVYFRPRFSYALRLTEPDCIPLARALAPNPRDCAEFLYWFGQVARRSSATDYTFGRHVNPGVEHAIELPFILSRPRSPSCGLYIDARSSKSERLLMSQVADAIEAVVNKCIDASPAMAGESFVTEQRNVFVKLTDQRQGKPRNTTLGSIGNRTTDTAKRMRRRMGTK